MLMLNSATWRIGPFVLLRASTHRLSDLFLWTKSLWTWLL